MNNFRLDEFLQNPYPVYSEWRKGQSPIFISHSQGTRTEGVWLITDYHSALQVLTDKDTFIKSNVSVKAAEDATIFDQVMLNQDGEDHKRLRKMVSSYFNRSSIAKLESEIKNVIESKVNAFVKEGGNFVNSVAEYVPLEIMINFLGLRDVHLHDIRMHSKTICDSFDSFLTNTANLRDQYLALKQLEKIVDDEIDFIQHTLSGKHQPKSISQQLVFNYSDGQLSYSELKAMLIFLLFAGHETTTNLLSSTLFLLLSHPEQLSVLQNDHSLIDSCIEEVIRFESPEQRTSFRLSTKTITLHNTEISKGSQVSVILGSANRDERVFDNPQVFDIMRKSNRHLSFGYGIHNCLGQHLSRLEIKVFLQCILPHSTYLKLNQNPVWNRNSFFRGLETLNITRG